MKLKQDHSEAVRAVKRCPTKLDTRQMVDQSHAKGCDINNIVAQFQKTGQLPTNTKPAHFGDFSEIPTVEDAFRIAHAARDAFQALSSTVRSLIDNDPSKLESFILNEDNKDLCIKYGLIEKPKVTPKVKPKDYVVPKTDSDSTVSNPVEPVATTGN